MGWNGWCSRREGDGYAPDDHDGSFLHHREPNCLNFVTAATTPTVADYNVAADMDAGSDLADLVGSGDDVIHAQESGRRADA